MPEGTKLAWPDAGHGFRWLAPALWLIATGFALGQQAVVPAVETPAGAQSRPEQAAFAARAVTLAEEELFLLVREAMLQRSVGSPAACRETLPRLRAALRKAELAREAYRRTWMDVRLQINTDWKRWQLSVGAGKEEVDRQLREVGKQLAQLDEGASPAGAVTDTARKALLQLRDALLREQALRQRLEAGFETGSRALYAEEAAMVNAERVRAIAYYRQLVQLEEMACSQQGAAAKQP